MRLLIIVVGRLKDNYLEAGLETYIKRLKRYGKAQIVRVKEEHKANRQAEPAAVAKEADRIRGHLKAGDTLIALTEEGQLLNSTQWAKHMERWVDRTTGRLVFVIGSGAGLCPSLKEEAHALLSLSPLTFPHQVALLLLLEQLYRGATILKNEPYHR